MDKLTTGGLLPVTDRKRPVATTRPRYAQIAADLRRMIASGEFRPGESLPSEHALMERFGASRGTVRQARALLRMDGTIGGSQGRLLAVRTPQLTQPLSQLVSFSAWVESLGLRPSAEIIDSRMNEGSAEELTNLELPAGTELFRLVRLRKANDEPLMIERTVFAPQLQSILSGFDLTRLSIYTSLAAAGYRVHSARHQLSAIAASRQDARLLGISAGTALLRVRRLGFSPSGEALEWSDDRYRGDRVEFAIENSALASGVVRRLEQPS